MKNKSGYKQLQDYIMKKIDHMSDKSEFIIITLFSLVLVFGVTGMMGTLTSGYHLVDDHQFLKYFYEMKDQGTNVFQIIVSTVQMDFIIRYRPLYYITRVFSVYFLGIDLVALSVMKAMEIVASIILLYYCGKRMGANKICSFLFSLLSMVGYQSATWWKLGTHEAQGTVLFAAGLLCMFYWLKTDKKKWAVISIILFILMCNYKESFILLMPFIMFYVLYEDLGKKEGVFTFIQIRDIIQRRFCYLLALGITFIIPVLVIIFFVGVNDYRGVGLDATVPWSIYKDAFMNAIQKDLKWYSRFGILFSLILLTYWDELKKLWKEIILTLLFLLPQFIIFGQAGITERYILPTSIGFTFFFVIIIPKWKPLSGKRRVVYMLGLLLLLAAHGRVMLREADYFRYRGESVTTMLESVSRMAHEDTKVLSCLRPNEEGNLTIQYWMKRQGFEHVYYWTEEDRLINQICDRNIYYPEDYYIPQDFEEMDIVVMYNKEDRHWCYTPSLDLSGFTELTYGTLTVYVREGRGIEMEVPEIEGLRIHF